MNTKTKVQWKPISNDIVSALDKIAKKHSVTFEANGWRYSDSDCVFRTKATVNDASGNKVDLAREEYIKFTQDRAYQHYGVKAEWLDKSFKYRQDSYTIRGYEPRKNHGIKTTRDSDGETYNFTIDSVVEAMKLA